MKVFVIGGVTVKRDAEEFDAEVEVLKKSMGILGRKLVELGHEVVVCSPFPDSADHHLLQGVNAASDKTRPVTVSIHYPQTVGVDTALQELLAKLSHIKALRFPCRVQGDPTSTPSQYDWLFAQLNAMDSSAGVILIGGKPSGSMKLLLHLADARNKRVLPLAFMGGAAQEHFDANRWDLQDLLGSRLEDLSNPKSIKSAPNHLEALLTGNQEGAEERTFFLSYARARPNEADYVETLLRRRNHVVYRDEESFEPSARCQAEIVSNIKRASVFIALWSREYACSPWCFDEMEIGLERFKKGLAELWIFCLDDTRMVPKAARALNYYTTDSREKLEGKILFLLTKLEEREGGKGRSEKTSRRAR